MSAAHLVLRAMSEPVLHDLLHRLRCLLGVAPAVSSRPCALCRVRIIRRLNLELEQAAEVIPALIRDVEPLQAGKRERVAWRKSQRRVVRLLSFVEPPEVGER